MSNENIVKQLKVYTERIEHWEAQLRNNTYEPGEFGVTKNFIKKHYELVDNLLDEMIKNNKRNLVDALDKC